MSPANFARRYGIVVSAALSAVVGGAMLFTALIVPWHALPPSVTGLGINTAVWFLLASGGLGALMLRPPWRERATTAAGIALTLIPSVVLVQFATDWYPDVSGARLLLNVRTATPNEWPGNMYPVAASVLAVCGGVLTALLHVKTARAGLGLQLCAWLVVAIGALSLFGHMLGIIMFGYEKTTHGYTSWPAGVGLVVVGAGLVVACAQQPWSGAFYTGRPDRRILTRGAILLGVLVLAAGLLATGIMDHGFDVMTTDAARERAIRITVATLSVFAAAAAWLFHAQLRPVVRELVSLKDELLKSGEAWRALVHSIPDIVMTVDRDYRLRFINRVPDGLSAEQVLGTSVVDYVSPDYRAMVSDAIDRTFCRGTIESYETRARGANDAPAWYATRVSPVMHGETVESALLTSRDITERRAFEETLFQREEEFRALSENSPDIISRFDQSLRRVYVNPAIEHVTGRPRSYFLGKRDDELDLPVATKRTWTDQLENAFLSGTSTAFDVTYPGSSGERHFQVRLVPEWNARGELSSMLAVARDISVLRVAEAVLRESEARFAAMTAHLPGMVFQLSRGRSDGALVFSYVSDGARDLCGVPAGAIQRNTHAFVDLIHVDDRDDFFRTIERSMAGDTWNWEGRLLTPHAGEQWVALRATLQAGRDTDPMWNGIVLNITTKKRQQIELAQSRERLRELSAHHEQVREDERRRISREIHDELGQTLTALKMETALVKKAYANVLPELTQRMSDMTRVIERGIDAVRAIAADLRPGVLDLGLAAAVEWQLGEFTRRAGIPCDGDITDEDLALDESHATALFRILQESLTNIARHAHALRVRVELHREGNNVHLRVEDDGIGMASTRGTTRTFGLLGMRERATILHGELHIDAPPGGGTRIHVSIPLNHRIPPWLAS